MKTEQVILRKKEAMNLNESLEGYTGGFVWGMGRKNHAILS